MTFVASRRLARPNFAASRRFPVGGRNLDLLERILLNGLCLRSAAGCRYLLEVAAMGFLKKFFRNVFRDGTPPRTSSSFEHLSEEQLEAHLGIVRYGNFLLSDAVRPSYDLQVVPAQGFRHDAYRDEQSKSSVPVLMAAVSSEQLSIRVDRCHPAQRDPHESADGRRPEPVFRVTPHGHHRGGGLQTQQNRQYRGVTSDEPAHGWSVPDRQMHGTFAPTHSPKSKGGGNGRLDDSRLRRCHGRPVRPG